MSELNNLDKLRDVVGKAEYKKLHEYNLQKGKVEECGINSLLINPYNRNIDKTKVERIKQDINRSGEIYPIVYSEVDNDGKKGKMVIDGHHRLQALRDMGHKKVPIVQSDHRGLKTKAPKQPLKKRQFRVGDKVKYEDMEGQIAAISTGNKYHVRFTNGRTKVLNGSDLTRV